MDRISTLPDNVIDLILGKLPVIDRVKTCVLSSCWRSRWTFHSSLILDFKFNMSVPKISNCLPVEYAYIITSILLQYGDGLKEFCLHIPRFHLSSRSLLLPSIGYVTRSKSLERLILHGVDDLMRYALPSSVFSAVHLKCLEIISFLFRPPSKFAGFPNLTHLSLDVRPATIDTVSDFVSRCPNLHTIILKNVSVNQNLNLKAPNLTFLCVHENFNHVSVPNAHKLDCLKFYSLSGVDLSRSAAMLKFFNTTTQVSRISLGGGFCKFLGSCSEIHLLPKFDRVMNLTFYSINLHDPDEYRCLSTFCACSPNVRRFRLKMKANQGAQATALLNFESMTHNYFNRDLGHLKRVDLFGIMGTKIELKFIESLLRLSPILEAMYIMYDLSIDQNAKVQFLEAMINIDRASAKAKVYYGEGDIPQQFL